MNNSLRFRYTNIYLYASIIILLLTGASVYAKNEITPNMQVPDVFIFIYAKNPGTSYVSVTFPNVLPKEKSEYYLASILKETGWTATSVKITNDSFSESGMNPMTSIEFSTPEGIRAGSVIIPIEPFIKAFRDLKTIQVLFLTPASFSYKGLGNFENQYVKIVSRQSPETYDYTITVKNPNFTTLNLPDPSRETAKTDAKSKGIGWGTITLVLILAIITAIIVYILTDKMIKNRSAAK